MKRLMNKTVILDCNNDRSLHKKIGIVTMENREYCTVKFDKKIDGNYSWIVPKDIVHELDKCITKIEKDIILTNTECAVRFKDSYQLMDLKEMGYFNGVKNVKHELKYILNNYRVIG